MTVKNKYKVPVAQWRKWNETERHLFNSMYSHMYDDSEFYLHPKQDIPKPVYWKTTAWNAAWMAADHLKDQRKEAKHGN